MQLCECNLYKFASLLFEIFARLKVWGQTSNPIYIAIAISFKIFAYFGAVNTFDASAADIVEISLSLFT